jgi:hypothetical protein
MTEDHAATLEFIRKMERSCKFFFLMIIKMDRLFHEKNLGAWPRLEILEYSNNETIGFGMMA